MGSYLDRIIEHTKVRLRDRMKLVPAAEVESRSSHAGTVRPLIEALRRGPVALIAEFKRRSPSAGEIRRGADPQVIVAAYERGGASAISVLTEPGFFGGSDADLTVARASCSLPVLRKDFIIEPYQVFEARALDADAVLLIVAAFEDVEHLREMMAVTHSLGMEALVEVHDESELDVALEKLDCSVVGVNQRDLRTFEVDTSLASRFRALIPQSKVMVAESGIKTRRDVEALENAGVDAFLVGESLMRSDDPAVATSELLGASR